MTKQLTILLSLLLAGAVHAAPPAEVSPAQALQAVREFEKNASPRLAHSHKTDGKYLSVKTDTGADYDVDLHTGRVISAHYRGTWEAPPSGQAKLTREEALEKARSYAGSHFARFMERPLKTEVNDSRWSTNVVYAPYLTVNGAQGGGFVCVDVDKVSGNVSFGSIYDDVDPVPAEATRQPAVSQQRAIQLAAAAVKMNRINSVKQAELHWFRRMPDHPASHLVWIVGLAGRFDDGKSGLRIVSVDAQDGSTLFINRVLTGDSPAVSFLGIPPLQGRAAVFAIGLGALFAFGMAICLFRLRSLPGRTPSEAGAR